jgi:preprotein translocase subunit Sec63
MASFPDYYDILKVPKDASSDDIRQAYRRESLKSVYTSLYRGLSLIHYLLRTHPDRLFNASIEEKKVATERFQVSAPRGFTVPNIQNRLW